MSTDAAVSGVHMAPRRVLIGQLVVEPFFLGLRRQDYDPILVTEDNKGKVDILAFPRHRMDEMGHKSHDKQ